MASCFVAVDVETGAVAGYFTLGAALLWDAVQRALQSPVATFAVMVDAKDEAAARFYQRHGFIAFAHAPLQMVLPLAGLKSAN